MRSLFQEIYHVARVELFRLNADGGYDLALPIQRLKLTRVAVASSPRRNRARAGLHRASAEPTTPAAWLQEGGCASTAIMIRLATAAPTFACYAWDIRACRLGPAAQRQPAGVPRFSRSLWWLRRRRGDDGGADVGVGFHPRSPSRPRGCSWGRRTRWTWRTLSASAAHRRGRGLPCTPRFSRRRGQPLIL